jgi:protein-disulfide isomerase/uncharacterized membrane protein
LAGFSTQLHHDRHCPSRLTVPGIVKELQSMLFRTRDRVAALCLTFLGILVSSFLLARTFSLLADSTAGGIDVCSAMFGSGCDDALRDRNSWLLGIPFAGWGLVFYSAVGCLLITGWIMRERFERDAAVAALLLAFAGAIAGIGLVAWQMAAGATVCPMCLAIHAANLVLIVPLKGLTGRTIPDLSRAVTAALWYLIGRKSPADGDAAWKGTAFLNAALISAVVYQWVYVEATLRGGARKNVDPARIVAAFEKLPRRDVPIASGDPRLGPADAPVQMVVFANFQCSGCRRLAAELPRLSREFGGGLSIVFKHYPLSTACNPRMKDDKHPRSCQAAYAAQASQRQGRFWEFHDALFSSAPNVSPPAIDRVVQDLRLNASQLAADAANPETKEKIAADVALGTRLKIRGTPAVFLNGRPVRPASRQVLEILIRHELAGRKSEVGRSKVERSKVGWFDSSTFDSSTSTQ